MSNTDKRVIEEEIRPTGLLLAADILIIMRKSISKNGEVLRNVLLTVS